MTTAQDGAKVVSLILHIQPASVKLTIVKAFKDTKYEGWNFNSGNYLFTTDTK